MLFIFKHNFWRLSLTFNVVDDITEADLVGMSVTVDGVATKADYKLSAKSFTLGAIGRVTSLTASNGLVS